LLVAFIHSGELLVIYLNKRAKALLRFRSRSTHFSFFEFTSGAIINAKHLSIMQIVQSHFAQAGQR
jgi:hypothetical protein